MERLPVVTSILPSSTVHTRLLLVEGSVPEVSKGDLQITPHKNHIPTQSVAIINGRFKCFIPLLSGNNEVELLYYCAKSKRPYSSVFYCTYVPLSHVPPLKLVILLGSDSACTYDDVPKAHHPPNLATAIKKLRLAAYIWAAYTSAQMAAGGLGQRSFRLDEAWLPDTISRQSDAYAQTANVQVLRSKYTVAEIRDPERAQQNHSAGSASNLFDIALETLRDNESTNGPKEHVAAMFLDAHYDSKRKLITGHAALGGGTSQHSLAIFGSHSLFSWPTCLEEIESCFTDESPVDKKHCGIDGEGSCYFAACNVGIGAMMHEVGHLFGCPHQDSGVMLRDYVRLHRSFTAIDPKHAERIVGRGHCRWHRLDQLRFLDHPSFALPDDRINQSGPISCLGTEGGLQIRSLAGIRVIEIYLHGHEFPKAWIETDTSETITISESELRARIGDQSGRIKLNVISRNCQSVTIDDISSLLAGETLDGIGHVWKSLTFGLQGGNAERVILAPSISNIRIFSGACLDGLEFHANDGHARSVISFGQKGGSPQDFALGSDEYIVGLGLRAGAWIDGIQIITNKRSSEMYGNRTGGSAQELRAPTGYRLCGIFGESSSWVMKIGMLYTRN